MSKFPLALIASALLSVSVFAAQVPRPAEDLTFKLPDGKEKHLSEYRGKVLAVIFMSPTCPHCQVLTQAIHGLPATYGPKGLQIVEIAFDAMASEIPGFNQKYQPPFPVGSAPRDKIEAFMQHSVMTPFMVPQMVLIDRQGVIQKQFAAGAPEFQMVPESLKGPIEALLNAAPEKKASSPAHKRAAAAKKS